jgi:hypothetical protein
MDKWGGERERAEELQWEGNGKERDGWGTGEETCVGQEDGKGGVPRQGKATHGSCRSSMRQARKRRVCKKEERDEATGRRDDSGDGISPDVHLLLYNSTHSRQGLNKTCIVITCVIWHNVWTAGGRGPYYLKTILLRYL